LLEPRRLTISLADTLPGIRLVLGEVDGLDLEKHRVKYGDPAGRRCELEYDRLIVAVGSVNRLLPVPGIAEHAHGFRGIPEALFLRDHLTQQIELADGTDDQNQRDALVQDEGGLMLAVTHAIDPHNVTRDVDLEPVLRGDRTVMGWVKLGPHTH
jgi:NADH dehydrogenase FAD-containing subunit